MQLNTISCVSKTTCQTQLNTQTVALGDTFLHKVDTVVFISISHVNVKQTSLLMLNSTSYCRFRDLFVLTWGFQKGKQIVGFDLFKGFDDCKKSLHSFSSSTQNTLDR